MMDKGVAPKGHKRFYIFCYKQVVPMGHGNLLSSINIANNFMSRRDYLFVAK